MHVERSVDAHYLHNGEHRKHDLLESRVKPFRQVSQELGLRQYVQPAGHNWTWPF